MTDGDQPVTEIYSFNISDSRGFINTRNEWINGKRACIKA